MPYFCLSHFFVTLCLMDDTSQIFISMSFSVINLHTKKFGGKNYKTNGKNIFSDTGPILREN